MTFYGMGYPFSQFWSAVLAFSFLVSCVPSHRQSMGHKKVLDLRVSTTSATEISVGYQHYSHTKFKPPRIIL